MNYVIQRGMEMYHKKHFFTTWGLDDMTEYSLIHFWLFMSQGMSIYIYKDIAKDKLTGMYSVTGR